MRRTARDISTCLHQGVIEMANDNPVKSVGFGPGLALCAAILLPAAAVAVHAAEPVLAQTVAKIEAVHDFRKLSIEGHKAIGDIAQARFAIFDGKPERAIQLIRHAQGALKLAHNDHTSFVKAEAEIKSPPGAPVPPAPPNTKPIAWLPVDGSIVLDDDYKAMPPEKIKALGKANQQLKKGDHAGARETLRLADVNVIDTVALMPLDETITRVDTTAGLLATGKYYEASQVLRQIEQSVRYGSLDFEAKPKDNTAASSKPADAASAASPAK
jgi:hypothetical protein